MAVITEAAAEQLRAARYPSCPACGRPSVTRGGKTVIDSQDGTTDNAWFARCAGLNGPLGLFRGMVDASGRPYHLNVRLGDRGQ